MPYLRHVDRRRNADSFIAPQPPSKAELKVCESEPTIAHSWKQSRPLERCRSALNMWYS